MRAHLATSNAALAARIASALDDLGVAVVTDPDEPVDIRFVDALPVASRLPSGRIVAIVERSAGAARAAFLAGAADVVWLDADPDEIRSVLPEATEWLEFTGDDGLAQRFDLVLHEPLEIGRDSTCALPFSAQVVSRRHARLDRRGDDVVVSDLGSRHGVYVDGLRILAETPLRDGAEIRLGKPTAPVIVFRRRGPTAAGPCLPEKDIRELAGLLDTFLRLRTEFRLDDVLEIVLLRSLEFADAERGLILLRQDDDDHGGAEGQASGELHPAMAVSRDGSPLDRSALAISRRIPAEVLRTGQGVVLNDILEEEDAQLHLRTIDLGVRSALCVPLVTRSPNDPDAQRLIGVMYLDSASRTRPFSSQLLRAVESLAIEAARAITNARLYQISEEKREIDRQIGLAREIQENLLPEPAYSSRNVELYGTSRPNLGVGGDVLAYYPEPHSGRLGLLLGDVSGKGISAAIFSSFLVGHFHHLGQSTEAHDLEERFEALNRYLITKSRGEKFVTAFFAILDPDGGLDWVNAGHNPPLVVRRSGEVELLPAGGTILGLLEDVEYGSSRTQLGSGDTLVVYSDGITEARNAARELYGRERLTELVRRERQRPPSSLHAEILRDVEEFAGEVPFDDDVTLIVLRYGDQAREPC